MAEVYDRWHLARPREGAEPCAHGTPTSPRYPSGDHGKGDRWQVRYRDLDGRQRKENFPKKAQADSRANKIGTELDGGTFLDPKLGKLTFRQYTESWRKDRFPDPNTAARIEREMRLHVYPVLGDRAMRELAARPSMCQTWVSGLDRAPATALQIVNDVSAVFASAVLDGVIGRNPIRTSAVRKPKVIKSRPTTWTPERVQAMTDALDGRSDTRRYAILPAAGAATGCRQAELFGLDVDESLDFLRRSVHVVRQVKVVSGVMVFAPVKNGKPHDAPLPDSLALLLSEYIRRYPPVAVTLPWRLPAGEPRTYRLLVTTPAGRAVNRNVFTPKWRSALRRAGIPATRLNGMHVLRHTAASEMLEGGVSITAVADALGDTVATISSTYAHKVPSGLDSARRVMDAYLKRSASALDVPSQDQG